MTFFSGLGLGWGLQCLFQGALNPLPPQPAEGVLNSSIPHPQLFLVNNSSSFLNALGYRCEQNELIWTLRLSPDFPSRFQQNELSI